MPHPDAKTTLALALRDALTTTPLSKVTVSGLTRTAGVTRQAFYYHFSDIRDLTVWVFKREVTNQINAHATYEDWSDGLLAMLVWIQSHPEETHSAISSLTMENLQLFLHKQLHSVIEPIVNQLGANLTLATDDLTFIVDHFTLCILGHISQWLRNDMKADPYILTERIARILDGQVTRALTLFALQPTTGPARS